MRRTATITAALLAAGLLLTACTASSEKTAKPSASPETTPAPAVEESATSAEDALKEADEDFEKALEDLNNALGETVGVHEGTYEVTNNQPEYADVAEALDDEYIAPGTYTTKGPADGAPNCYWARMRDASGGTGSIIANDLVRGRAIVTLKEGEFFKTSGCKPWTSQGS